MKLFAIAGLMALLPILATNPIQQDTPTKQHEWLQQLVGEWEGEVEEVDAEGGTRKLEVPDSNRRIGDYWIVSESTVPFREGSTTSLRTYGYDSTAKEFVGTWLDSTSSYLWVYRGSLDAERRTLTLESDGPGFDGNLARYREMIELDGPDRRVHKNFILDEDKQWLSIGEAVFLRKK